MITPSIAAPRPLPMLRGRLLKLSVIGTMVALADWLFFGHAVGISVALFTVALAAAVLIANAVQSGWREVAIATGILIVALLPILEAPSAISILFAMAGLSYFALTAATRISGSLRDKGIAIATLLLAAPFQIFADLIRTYDSEQPRDPQTTSAGPVAAWIIPLLFAGIFLALFASANPVIENWFVAIDPRSWLAHLDFARVSFWAFAFALTWPFIWMRARRIVEVKFELPPLEASELATWKRFFGEAVILRSLVVFNLMFAVQTSMDIAYLWRGVALPDGMSYASYAHRGAYPLILTALLAASFVIAAMRPGSAAERAPVIRALVFLWIAQNVVLVVSSMLRLDLYVEIYSLTYLRAAAFIWMLLVAIGLILIVVRILLRRSNNWLIFANLGVLMLMIYVCSFINFACVIASYNVEHSWEGGGRGQLVDIPYLADLGPQAIPAMDHYLAITPRNVGAVGARHMLSIRRDQLAAAELKRNEDWRAWSFRDWRLQHYLESGTSHDGSLR
jgi:Domain of unknown function (DUF4173)